MKLKTARKEAKVAFDNPFKGLKPETEQTERKMQVKENEAMKKLVDHFKKYLHSGRSYGLLENEAHREYGINIIHLAIGNIMPTAKEIELFIAMLNEFEYVQHFNPRAGLFLSALVNLSKDRKFTIDVSHLSVAIDWLGLHNTKKVHVIGHLGEEIANYHGIISKSSRAERVPNSKFVVDGNVGDNAGASIVAGKLVINGNARWMLGKDRKGGEIHVNGDYGTLGTSKNRIDMYIQRCQIEWAEDVG